MEEAENQVTAAPLKKQKSRCISYSCKILSCQLLLSALNGFTIFTCAMLWFPETFGLNTNEEDQSWEHKNMIMWARLNVLSSFLSGLMNAGITIRRALPVGSRERFCLFANKNCGNRFKTFLVFTEIPRILALLWAATKPYSYEHNIFSIANAVWGSLLSIVTLNVEQAFHESKKNSFEGSLHEVLLNDDPSTTSPPPNVEAFANALAKRNGLPN